MDQQVSPAVVIIVLILIVAILVGLYFLVVERTPQSGDVDSDIEIAPMDDTDAPMSPDTDVSEANGETEAGGGSDQGDVNVGQIDSEADQDHDADEDMSGAPEE